MVIRLVEFAEEKREIFNVFFDLKNITHPARNAIQTEVFLAALSVLNKGQGRNTPSTKYPVFFDPPSLKRWRIRWRDKMAGQGDLPGPNEDRAGIPKPTFGFSREKKFPLSPGTICSLLKKFIFSGHRGRIQPGI